MPSSSPIYYQVEARGKVLFACSICEATEQGSVSVKVQLGERGNLANLTGNQVGERLSRVRGTSYHMPIGWGSYHPDIHKCPKCQGNK